MPILAISELSVRTLSDYDLFWECFWQGASWNGEAACEAPQPPRSTSLLQPQGHAQGGRGATAFCFPGRVMGCKVGHSFSREEATQLIYKLFWLEKVKDEADFGFERSRAPLCVQPPEARTPFRRQPSLPAPSRLRSPSPRLQLLRRLLLGSLLANS